MISKIQYCVAVLLCPFLLIDDCLAQNTVAQRLGYPANAKLLIIHADDLGVSNSENKASITAMENGLVNSASIMVPTPWFPQIAAYAKENSGLDFGLHLTLNSEWKTYKWGPVSPLEQVSSLVNDYGHFYETQDSVLRMGKPAEVELEIRNQVLRAIEFGIDVTHLDAHMYTLRMNPDFLKAHIEVGRQFNLPVFLPKDEPIVQQVMKEMGSTPEDVLMDKLYMAFNEDFDNGLEDFYTDVIVNLPEGLSCLLVHTAYDNDEMKAMTAGYDYYASDWRQIDYDFFTRESTKELLGRNGVILVTWREIRDKIVRAE